MLIEHFSEALRAGEPERLTALLAEDVVLHASVPSAPFVGRDAIVFVFRMLQEVCEEIEYVAQYGDDGGCVLTSRGRIGGLEFDGAQVLRLDDGGLVVEMRDSMRPYSALTALKEAAAEYLARASSSGAPPAGPSEDP